MSAYQQGSTYDNEDWLVSPAVDLSKSRTLAFEQAFGPANKDMSNAAEIYTLWVSDNYSGDVATATWTQVAIEYPSESGGLSCRIRHPSGYRKKMHISLSNTRIQRVMQP